MSARCQAYLPSSKRWIDAYALEVFETGQVLVLAFAADLGTFEMTLPVWRLR